jgi:hypothetical protein
MQDDTTTHKRCCAVKLNKIMRPYTRRIQAAAHVEHTFRTLELPAKLAADMIASGGNKECRRDEVHNDAVIALKWPVQGAP